MSDPRGNRAVNLPPDCALNIDKMTGAAHQMNRDFLTFAGRRFQRFKNSLCRKDRISVLAATVDDLAAS
jgi:hypothetical protein